MFTNTNGIKRREVQPLSAELRMQQPMRTYSEKVENDLDQRSTAVQPYFGNDVGHSHVSDIRLLWKFVYSSIGLTKITLPTSSEII
jgi:hypothetical protein